MPPCESTGVTDEPGRDTGVESVHRRLRHFDRTGGPGLRVCEQPGLPPAPACAPAAPAASREHRPRGPRRHPGVAALGRLNQISGRGVPLRLRSRAGRGSSGGSPRGAGLWAWLPPTTRLPGLSLSTRGGTQGGPAQRRDVPSPPRAGSPGATWARGGRLGQGHRARKRTKTWRASKRQPRAGSPGCLQLPERAGFT